MSHNPPTPRAEQAFFYYEMCLEAQRTPQDAIDRTTKLFGSDDSFIARRMHELHESKQQLDEMCEGLTEVKLELEDKLTKANSVISAMHDELRDRTQDLVAANDLLVQLLKPADNEVLKHAARTHLVNQGFNV